MLRIDEFFKKCFNNDMTVKFYDMNENFLCAVDIETVVIHYLNNGTKLNILEFNFLYTDDKKFLSVMIDLDSYTERNKVLDFIEIWK